MVHGDDPRTRVAWGVWRTGPHCAWHLTDLHGSRREARKAAAAFKRDGFTDGVCIRHVRLDPPDMHWDKHKAKSRGRPR